MLRSQLAAFLRELFDSVEQIQAFVEEIDANTAGDLPSETLNRCAERAAELLPERGLLEPACALLSARFPHRLDEIIGFRPKTLLTAIYGDVGHYKQHPSGVVVFGRASRLQHLEPVADSPYRVRARWARLIPLLAGREPGFATLDLADSLSRAQAVFCRDGGTITVTALPETTLPTWAGPSLSELVLVESESVSIGRSGVVVVAEDPAVPSAIRLCLFAGAEAYHADRGRVAPSQVAPRSTIGPSGLEHAREQALSAAQAQQAARAPAERGHGLHGSRDATLQQASVSYTPRRAGNLQLAPTVEQEIDAEPVVAPSSPTSSPPQGPGSAYEF